MRRPASEGVNKKRRSWRWSFCEERDRGIYGRLGAVGKGNYLSNRNSKARRSIESGESRKCALSPRPHSKYSAFMANIMNVRVRYRRAKLVSKVSDQATICDKGTLEDAIRALLKGKLASDVNSRVLPTIEDERHKLCLHFSSIQTGSVAFDLLHLDDRTEFKTWKVPKTAVPISAVSGTKVPANEVSLQEPAYLMIAGDHVAVIERIGLRTPSIERYLNQILEKSGSSTINESYWKLVPKIESVGVQSLKGGVEKIILKPRAALSGSGHSQVETIASKSRKRARKIDEFIGHGAKILDMLEVFGAKQSDIEKLREQMSSDLVLKARVEISVLKAERATEARVSADDIQTAFAHLTDTSDIEVIDRDGKTNGKLTQLSHQIEVVHDDGIIDPDSAIAALAAAMSSWAAKGAISLT